MIIVLGSAACQGGCAYADIIAEMDVRVGQVLDAIKAAGVDDKTLVVLSRQCHRRAPGRGRGRGRLERTEHDLVDEVRLMLYPLALGGGRRLFGEMDDKRRFRLRDSKVFGDGIVLIVYERAAAE